MVVVDSVLVVQPQAYVARITIAIKRMILMGDPPWGIEVGDDQSVSRRQLFWQDKLQQLIRIHINGREDVFGKRELVERFADEAAQAHDGFAAHQNVKAKLAL